MLEQKMLKSIIRIVGSFGEPVINSKGLKLRDFDTYNDMAIMNFFYKHKIYIHIHGQLTIPNNYGLIHCKHKLSEVFLVVSVYRGSGVCSDHFFTLAKSRFLQKRLYLPRKTLRTENTHIYKIILLHDESKRWLYRFQQKLKEIPKSINIVLGWTNIKTIISEAANESSGRYKTFTQKN
jgi:hypothetical protein